MKKVVTYPQMGDYNVPIYYLLTHILHCEVKKPLKISDRTVELGNKYSPTVIAAAITSQIGKNKLPTHIELDSRNEWIKSRFCCTCRTNKNY